MGRTDYLSNQHKELFNIVQKMEPLLMPVSLCENAGAVHRLLATLADKLIAHLDIEDDNLYPALLGSSSEKVRSTAQSFIDDMGKLAPTFIEYVSRWDKVAIEEDPVAFIFETKSIFQALAKRIEKETSILYPMADENK